MGLSKDSQWWGDNDKWWDGAYNAVTGDYDLGEHMSKTSKKNFKKQGYAIGWDGKSFDQFYDEATERTGEPGMRGSGGLDGWANPGYNNMLTELRRAGIGPDQAFHLAHGAGLTNINSMSDIEQIIAARDKSNTSEPELETRLESFEPKGKEDPVTPEPVEEEPPAMTEDDERVQNNFMAGYYDVPQQSFGETWMAAHAANQANQNLAWAKKQESYTDGKRYGQGGRSSFDTKYSTTAKARIGLTGSDFAGSRAFRDSLMSYF